MKVGPFMGIMCAGFVMIGLFVYGCGTFVYRKIRTDVQHWDKPKPAPEPKPEVKSEPEKSMRAALFTRRQSTTTERCSPNLIPDDAKHWTHASQTRDVRSAAAAGVETSRETARTARLYLIQYFHPPFDARATRRSRGSVD